MKKISLTLLAGILCLAASAQEPVSEALPFMQMDFNPSSIAMGSTRIPSAAILHLSGTKLAADVAYESYMPELSGTQYVSGGAAGTYGKFGASIGFTRGTGDEITGERFTPSEILVNAGLSYAVTPMIAAGVNVKYAKEQLLSNYSNNAVAADVFVAGKLDAFDFAAGVSSLGGQVESESTGKFNLPSAVTLGCGYLYDLNEEICLYARLRGDYYFSGNPAAGLGVEGWYKGMFAVRAGYHYGGESVIPNFASAGLGARIGEFPFDAAYIFASEALMNSFSICAGVRF